ncbi:unnamed protein product [Vitrella brassicaformis CCMP3155]|uniref:Uncharacterized protein n=1 Tax=Vitrella brassicaformis (strain CCMP3155) TaxID=1169540 RepID=A0A0G4FFW5_VITBC|nr:unnamed protein product [Vitrella brassicaformis CCMP3155]|eukprot:CEM12081.1 unnamed protein product [Vitrella brassicaformis CCMP3155]
MRLYASAADPSGGKTAALLRNSFSSAQLLRYPVPSSWEYGSKVTCKTRAGFSKLVRGAGLRSEQPSDPNLPSIPSIATPGTRISLGRKRAGPTSREMKEGTLRPSQSTPALQGKSHEVGRPSIRIVNGVATPKPRMSMRSRASTHWRIHTEPLSEVCEFPPLDQTPFLKWCHSIYTNPAYIPTTNQLYGRYELNEVLSPPVAAGTSLSGFHVFQRMAEEPPVRISPPYLRIKTRFALSKGAIPLEEVRTTSLHSYWRQRSLDQLLLPDLK